jgi:hypothetical protein
VCLKTTTAEGVNDSSHDSLDTGILGKLLSPLVAAEKMINNSKKLSRNPERRCFVSESSDYERKRQSIDGLNAQYD